MQACRSEPDSTPGGNYTFSVTAIDGNKLTPSNGPQTLTLTAAAVLQHVVVIFQENRSPDILFHDSVLISRGADIASSGINSVGETIPLSPIDLGTVALTLKITITTTPMPPLSRCTTAGKWTGRI